MELQQEISLLEDWISVNTGTENIDGLALFLNKLKDAFSVLDASVEEISLPAREHVDSNGAIVKLPVGNALKLTKRPEAKKQVLLVGHMDTVYPETSAFQTSKRVDENILQGPGAADMKGGLLILLEALKMHEASSNHLGWQVIITPDEEVGSPSSRNLLIEASKRAQFGLIFEPSFHDGTLVSSRKGSATISVIAKGKAAHVGRDPHLGRSAITALAEFIVNADALKNPDTIINFGHIHGGTASNVVPELAICKISIRSSDELAIQTTINSLRLLTKQAPEGTTLTLVVHTERPPKLFDKKTEALFEELRQCAQELSMNINWQPSGGVCDGNLLAAAGLPNIDTLGAIGGKIHTHEEYIVLESLTSRSQLVAHFLNQYAEGKYGNFGR